MEVTTRVNEETGQVEVTVVMSADCAEQMAETCVNGWFSGEVREMADEVARQVEAAT